MRPLLLILFTSFFLSSNAQELFSYTEPASNMAAGSIGLRANNMLMNNSGANVYHFNPEIMWGISRKFMLHADAFFSNMHDQRQFKYDGASLYLKFRFYSEDEVHSHFRMALYGRGSVSNTFIHAPSIDLNGENTGFETGVVATKLINKIALSASASVLHAIDNGSNKFSYGNSSRNAIGYTLSIGKLMLPKEYTDYNQTNLNMMVELLGQYNPGAKASWLDVAPSLQLIFLSRLRLDLGYRFAIANDLYRSAEKGFLLRMEYNLFNVFK